MQLFRRVCLGGRPVTSQAPVVRVFMNKRGNRNMHDDRAVRSETKQTCLPALFVLTLVLGVIFFGGFPRDAGAINFTKGEFYGSVDTTVNVGGALRLQGQSPELVGVCNGGTANSINTDNGNLNYNVGDPVSGQVRVTHEIDLTYKNFGFFGRFYYFYDWVIENMDTRRTPLPEAASQFLGRNIRLMDAYLTADFDIAKHPITIRVGNQVLSWGESTFIQNGVNIINPVDVAQLRIAGREIRDVLIPVPMISLNANLTENLAIEGFYQFYWQQTQLEPQGTFFSTSDLAGPGANVVYLGFGRLPPSGPTDWPPTPTGDITFTPLGSHVYRGDDNKPSDMGQGGVALRYFADWLNDTEFSLFYVHYHSRLPLLSGFTGNKPPQEWTAYVLQQLGHKVLGSPSYGFDYASTGSYIREFPSDIDVVSAGFNTDFGRIGLAMQGEISYRPNQPLQLDDVELLFAALSPMDSIMAPLLSLPTSVGGKGFVLTDDVIFGHSQLCWDGQPYDFNTYIRGWKRHQVLQPQITLTKIFGPMPWLLGVDQLVIVGEAACTWVMDMDQKDSQGFPLRYEGPGSYASANPWFSQPEHPIQPTTSAEARYALLNNTGYADHISAGYRIAMKADFHNAIGPVGLQPIVAWAHDFYGTSPSPILNFVEGRKTVTVSLIANYLNSLRVKIDYTNYFGGESYAGGNFNLSKDRDFVACSASYSF